MLIILHSKLLINNNKKNETKSFVQFPGQNKAVLYIGMRGWKLWYCRGEIMNENCTIEDIKATQFILQCALTAALCHWQQPEPAN